MKTILVPTDFSSTSINAAHYATALASRIHAVVQLCHVIKIPFAESDDNTHEASSKLSSEEAKSTEAINSLAKELIQEVQPHHEKQSETPTIVHTIEAGTVSEVLCNVVHQQHISLVVMGMSGIGALGRFFFGSNSREMINTANFPVLFIPPQVVFQGLNKIALAIHSSTADLEMIESIVNLATNFDAEVLIADVEGKESNQLLDKINYPKAHYHSIQNKDVNQALERFIDYESIDLLAVVQHHNEGILTKKLASHINIPLLVLPVHSHPHF